MSLNMKIVKWNNGYYPIIREWNWNDNPQMKIYEDNSYKERLYEDFLDLELNGQLKITKYSFGPLPIKSNFHRVNVTVCKKDVEFIEL